MPLLFSLFAIITGISGIAATAGTHFFEKEGLGGWWGEAIGSPLADYLVGIYVTQVVFFVSVLIGVVVIANLVNKDFSFGEFLKNISQKSMI